MALKGFFRKQHAVLPNGLQRNIYSFVLQNTDWMGQQSVVVVLSDMGMTRTASYNVSIKAGKAVELDVRNTGWDWCVGDFAMIVDNKGKEKMRWNFTPTLFAPGSCPDCHGTHLCKACGGRGRWTDGMRNYVYCPVCFGTGQCQTCYVPVRNENAPMNESPATNNQEMKPTKRRRSPTIIQGKIREKERELEQVTRDLNNRTNPPPTRVMTTAWPYPGTTIYEKPKGDFGSYTFFLSRRKANLEIEIKELYRELAEAESEM